MNKPLTIDIVSDVSCPWCIIGYQSLSAALVKLAPQITARISWKPFELNPNMPATGHFWVSICTKNTARQPSTSLKPET